MRGKGWTTLSDGEPKRNPFSRPCWHQKLLEFLATLGGMVMDAGACTKGLRRATDAGWLISSSWLRSSAQCSGRYSRSLPLARYRLTSSVREHPTRGLDPKLFQHFSPCLLVSSTPCLSCSSSTSASKTLPITPPHPPDLTAWLFAIPHFANGLILFCSERSLLHWTTKRQRSCTRSRRPNNHDTYQHTWECGVGRVDRGWFSAIAGPARLAGAQATPTAIIYPRAVEYHPSLEQYVMLKRDIHAMHYFTVCANSNGTLGGESASS